MWSMPKKSNYAPFIHFIKVKHLMNYGLLCGGVAGELIKFWGLGLVQY
jgi:hypothetical protein